MNTHILFFQGGGGQEDHEADAKMVASLQSHLGSNYEIHYPLLPNEEAPDFGRLKQIAHEISVSQEPLILVAHSLAASMLLKYLSEVNNTKQITGVFLIATPFWSGKEDWEKPLTLKPDFAERLDQQVPLSFYHCRDDQEVPFAQFELYKKYLPWATFCDIPSGGHQLDNGLKAIAHGIDSI